MLQPTIMEPHVRWSEVVSQLKPEDEDLLFGTSLSRRFSRLPLWLSHPQHWNVLWVPHQFSTYFSVHVAIR